MKAWFDRRSKKWWILEKQMIFVGKMSWIIKEKGFTSKHKAEERINFLLDNF